MTHSELGRKNHMKRARACFYHFQAYRLPVVSASLMDTLVLMHASVLARIGRKRAPWRAFPMLLPDNSLFQVRAEGTFILVHPRVV